MNRANYLQVKRLVDQKKKREALQLIESLRKHMPTRSNPECTAGFSGKSFDHQVNCLD